MGYSKAQKVDTDKKNQKAAKAAAKAKRAAEPAAQGPRGKRGAAAAEADNPPSPEEPPAQRARGESDDYNSEYYKKVQDAITKIVACDVFASIRTDDPLPMDASLEEHNRGDMAPFDFENFKDVMGGKGSYRCAANIWWMDMFRVVTKGVPYNPGQVQRLMTYLFKEICS